MIIKYQLLSDKAQVPAYASAGAACFDLCAAESAIVRVGEQRMVSTDIAVEVPLGHALLIYSRSGHAAKHRVRLSNCVGVIDSDYRGAIKIMLSNDGDIYKDRPLAVNVGDRIAQGMIVATPVCTLTQGELSGTERGDGGFGSTGQ